MISEMILPQQENKYIIQKVNMLFPFVFQIGFMKILHTTNLWTQSLAIVLIFFFKLIIYFFKFGFLHPLPPDEAADPVHPEPGQIRPEL